MVIVVLKQYAVLNSRDIIINITKSASLLCHHDTGYGETVDIECGGDGCSATRDECQPIAIPSNDPAFAGKKCLEFVRSQPVPNLSCSMGL